MDNYDSDSSDSTLQFTPVSFPGTPVPLSTPETTGLESLPHYLLLQILKHLSLRDLCALSLTSKPLHTTTTPYLYRTADFTFSPTRNRSLLSALQTHAPLVRRIVIPPFLSTDPQLSQIEVLLQGLCATGQLESIIYPQSLHPHHIRSDGDLVSRTRVGVEAIAKAQGLRYLLLGTQQVEDSLFSSLGLASGELLEFATTFRGCENHDWRGRGVAEEMARPAPRIGDVNGFAVTKPLLRSAQGTLTAVCLDANEVNEPRSGLEGVLPWVVNASELEGFFEGLRFGRLQRLALWNWNVGGGGTGNLLAAVDFERLMELRLQDCSGTEELVAEMVERGMRLRRLKKLLAGGREERMVQLLGMVQPGVLEELDLLVGKPAETAGDGQPVMGVEGNSVDEAAKKELVGALVLCGSALRRLELRPALGWVRVGIVLTGDALGRLMNAFPHIEELSVTVDFGDWVQIVQHLSIPQHLRSIHLRQHRFAELDPQRTNPKLLAMATHDYEHSYWGPHTHPHLSPRKDAKARGFLLDLVESVLLPFVIRAPLHRNFDFHKDTTLRRVGIEMCKAAIDPGVEGWARDYGWMAGYNVVANKRVRSWNFRSEEGRGEVSEIEAVKVVVGGWEVGLEPETVPETVPRGGVLECSAWKGGVMLGGRF